MRIRIALTIALGLCSLAACGSNDAKSADHTAPSSSTASTATEAAYDGPTIPVGTYEKDATVAEIRQLGAAAFAKKNWGTLGPVHIVRKFADTSWAEFNSLSGETLELGSDGTYRYDEDGHVVLDEPCCGSSVLAWTIDGDRLTLTPLDGGQASQDPVARLMAGGTWTLTE